MEEKDADDIRKVLLFNKTCAFSWERAPAILRVRSPKTTLYNVYFLSLTPLLSFCTGSFNLGEPESQ